MAHAQAPWCAMCHSWRGRMRADCFLVALRPHTLLFSAAPTYCTELHDRHEDWLSPSSASTRKICDLLAEAAWSTHKGASSFSSMPGGATMGGGSSSRSGLRYGDGGGPPLVHPNGQLLLNTSLTGPNEPASSMSMRPLTLGPEAASSLVVPKEIEDKVVLLAAGGSAQLHTRLHNLPALVLDCEADVDVERDREYRESLSGQVSCSTRGGNFAQGRSRL